MTTQEMLDIATAVLAAARGAGHMATVHICAPGASLTLGEAHNMPGDRDYGAMDIVRRGQGVWGCFPSSETVGRIVVCDASGAHNHILNGLAQDTVWRVTNGGLRLDELDVLPLAAAA